MVGGEVIEALTVDRERRWVNCRSRTYPKDTCAIYIRRTTEGDAVAEGDQLWWQGRLAFHTPAANRLPEEEAGHLRGGVDYDIEIPRIGFSGVPRPEVVQ